MSSARRSARTTLESSSVCLPKTQSILCPCEPKTNVNQGEVGKLLGEKWKGLTDKQRAPYESKAAADKKRYEDEKAAYNVSTRAARSSRSTPTNMIAQAGGDDDESD